MNGTPCPVCNSFSADVLYEVTADESAQHYVLREGDPLRHSELAAHIRSLWQGDICTLKRCRICEFGFADPYVAGDPTFYRLAYPRTGYAADKWDFARTLQALEESSFRGSRVLEVGAGLGHFLDKIMDRHVPRSGIAALEFSTTGIETLRRKGYLALQEDIRTAGIEPGFDAIFLFQVVEHMDGLDGLFRRLSDLLAPGGRVFISVPHGKNADFSKKSGWLLEMPPNHIGLWSRQAFAIIGARHNLEVREIDLEPFSLREFVMQDIGSSYLRRTQKAGTLANWSRSKRTGRNGKLIGVACAAAMAPLRIPVWMQAAKGGEQMCGSFWVEFRKAAP